MSETTTRTEYNGGHVPTCTALLTGDAQTQYNAGASECFACRCEAGQDLRADMKAEGIDLAVLDAERAGERRQASEDAVLDGLYRSTQEENHMNQRSEYAENDTKKMIRIHLQAQAPCTFESILHWCKEQDPDFSEERTEWALKGLRSKGLVLLWDGLEGQFEYRY